MNVFQQTKHALGSDTVLTLATSSRSSADQLFAELWDYIDGFERRFSRFLPDSELTMLNNEAGRSVRISSAMHDILSCAQQYAKDSGNLYNPFVLPALQRAGYKSSWPHPDAPTRLDYRDRRVYPIDSLSLTPHTVHIPADSALDLGGIGKGYLLDRLAESIEYKCQGYWISLGGDIVCGGSDATGRSWQLHVQAAMAPGHTIASVNVPSDGRRHALATSGITKRSGANGNGSRWHHLVDPVTGDAAITDVLTASVAADSATKADVMASCLVVLGQQRGNAFATARQLDALIQTTHGTEFSQPSYTIGSLFTRLTSQKAMS